MKVLTSTQSMSLNDIECPWPADGADLSLADLNEIEKTWLVHQVVAKLQITKKLAELYHLKPDTLRSFAHLSAEKKTHAEVLQRLIRPASGKYVRNLKMARISPRQISILESIRSSFQLRGGSLMIACVNLL